MDKPVTLKGNSITIGRGTDVDIRLSSPKVSGRHARLEHGLGGWTLHDEGSSNGTLVNGTASVPITGPNRGKVWSIVDGDLIELADTRLLVRGNQLWVPADADVASHLTAGGTGLPLVAWLAGGAMLLFVLMQGRSGPVTVDPVADNASATQAAWAAAQTAAAPTATVPATDTPMPIPTRPPTRRPRPTATTGQTVAGPTARPPATADGPGPTVTAITFPTGPLPAGGQLVLADYFAWFDDWDKCNVSAGDRPAEPYHSDDSNVIRRQVEQARNAGIDGFTLHWVGRGDRTDANFGRLLEASRGTAFRSTVVVEQHFFRGAKSVDEVAEALRYVMDTYGGHPSFLRYGDRPVLFFVDMDRIAGNNGNRAGAAAAWAEVRRRVDPRREAVWIAEGDNSAMPYLDVFDGLYTYRVVHKGMPLAYQKLPRYAQELRTKAKAVGRRLLWVATIMPGWDDLRSSCIGDVRVPAPLFKRDRENGAFYRSTFQTALSTAPDILYVNSFNEWVEGHYIEPSAAYGDLYLNLTREFVSQYKRTN